MYFLYHYIIIYYKFLLLLIIYYRIMYYVSHISLLLGSFKVIILTIYNIYTVKRCEYRL